MGPVSGMHLRCVLILQGCQSPPPTILMHVEALLPARSEHKDLSCGLTTDTYMHLPSMRLGCWYDGFLCSGPAVQAWAGGVQAPGGRLWHCVSERNSHLQCVPAQRQGTAVAGKLIGRRSAPTWVFG